MAYSGMGLIPGENPNPATQLWLVARGIEAVTLLLAPGYLQDRPVPRWSFAALGTLAGLGAALALGGLLPAVFIPGQGLAPGKIAAEYTLIALLAAAAWRLHSRRHRLDADLYRALQGVIVLTTLSEFAFTAYVSVYGLSNLVGHIFKFWAFWLLLLAISRWMLAHPFRLLSRSANSFDIVPVPVLLVDDDGTIQSCNEAARREYPEGGVGRHIHAVWHPASLPRAECPVCQALTAGQAIEVDLIDPERTRWSSVRLHPIRGGAMAEDARGFVCAVTDVTRHRQAEERLLHAEKMEAIGELTGGLAHDFNNLLGIILGGLDLLGERLGDDDKARRHHDLAVRAARRAAEVTKSLLAVARKQSLEPRNLDIDATLAELMPLIHQSAGRGITVESHPCSGCTGLQARVDPAGLGSALLNLVINARDAMPTGGLLRIDTRLVSHEPGDLGGPANLRSGRYIVIAVSDNGCGMPAEVAARAFEPFYTTKETGKGTGLGLAMVYGFARQSGGTATLYSQPLMGTTVRIYLPAVGDRPPAATAADSPEAPPGSGQRLLVVDDEADLLDVAAAWLESLGYRVTRAGDADEAVARLAAEPFDLLLTDIMMPGQMNGIALAQWASAARPGLRVLLSSGYAGDMKGAGWPLLQKPYSRTELAIEVARALAADGNQPTKEAPN
jgi:signal transduction histidine kinase